MIWSCTCRHGFLKEILQASCKQKDIPVPGGNISLNILLARSPEEHARIHAHYPESNRMTTGASALQKDSVQLADNPQKHQEAQGAVQASDQAAVLKPNAPAAIASPVAVMQADKYDSNMQNSAANCDRLARPEEINEMVVAAEQLAMPVANEFDLGRGKRPRLVETYKEPDGREFWWPPLCRFMSCPVNSKLKVYVECLRPGIRDVSVM